MWSKLVGLIFIFFLGNHLCWGEDDEDLPEIDTPLGRVRGFWKTTLGGRKHAAFEGIPYGKPPIGDLRFEEPQPVSAWQGIWEANDAQTCMQADLFSSTEIFGQEDCLYLNVYVPAEFLDDTTELDVVVSIHGGAFMVGSGHSTTSSGILLDRDIVLVSINYRVGVLGFLSTEDEVIPGNFGLKDQVLALKWIKDNIASFNGNPNSVTIAGLSAGGASVHLHYFSPLSKDLFVRGVSQSGSALAPWAVRKNAAQRARKLATLVGCPDGSSEQLKSCLKERPSHSLLQQVKYFYGIGNLPLSPFAPVVEKGGANPFLNKDPYWLLKEGKVLDVPWITSFASDDGLLPSAFFWTELDVVDQNWVYVAPFLLDFNDTIPVSKQKEIPKEILEYYLGEGEHIDKDNFKRFTKILTDRLYAEPAELAAKLQAKANKSPVYFYVFNYSEGETKMVQFYARSPDVKGVAHGEDGIYFYGVFQKAFSGKDELMKNACQDMLYTFASTGKPSFDGSDIWQPTESTELTYLTVTGPDNLQLRTVETLTSIEFWTELELLENERIIVKDEL